VGDGSARAGVAGKEELEQEFVAGRIVAVRESEPLLQTRVTGGGDGILLAVGAGFGAGTGWDDELLGGQTFEGWVDLAKAFAPEEADALLDGFADLVSGLVWMDGEDTENHIGGLAALHISRRYI